MVSAKGHPNELDVDKLVLATVNAPYKREITAPVLKECLLQPDAGEWLVHVATFFTDVSPTLIFAFASSHAISRVKLAQAYLAMKARTGEQSADLEIAFETVASVA